MFGRWMCGKFITEEHAFHYLSTAVLETKIGQRKLKTYWGKERIKFSYYSTVFNKQQGFYLYFNT